MSELLIASGPRAGTRVRVDDGLEIGRSAGCRIRIHDDRASRVHARLLLQEGEVVLEDLGSRNGTLLNGERATGFSRLHPGDRIRIGRTTFVFEPDVCLLPAHFSGGLLLLDDEISVVEMREPVREKGGRRWEEELVAAGRRLQTATDPAAVAQVLAEETLRVLRARGVAVVEGSGATGEPMSPVVIIGLSHIALPGALIREVQVRGKVVEATIDRSGSAAVEEMEKAPTAMARLVLAPLSDVQGPRGVIVAELSTEASVLRQGSAVVALAALGGLALRDAQRCEALALREAFHRRRGDRVDPLLQVESEVMRSCVRQVLGAASEGRSFRLLGEAGTGRIALACMAHAHDTGGEAPLALHEPIFPDPEAARLFGIEGHGDSPGSIEPGLLERARGGTCIVRGFARLPRAIQNRLLDAVERGMIVREGGQRPVDLKIRVVLIDDEVVQPSRAVQRRMKTLGFETVEVPPLRDRAADLVALLEVCLREAARAVGRVPPPVSDALRREIASRRWPRNLPELASFAEAALAATPRDSALLLPEVGAQSTALGAEERLFDRVAAVEAATIRAAMEEAGGRKAGAARRLGISRPTLDRKLRRYGL